MVQTLSQLNVADNSGATKAKVIKILRPKNKKYGVLGDLVMVAIQKNIPHSKIRKGHIAKAILIRSNVKTSLISHLQTWGDSHLILVNTKGGDYLPIGSRIKGPISSKLKNITGMQKIISISKRSL